MLEEKNGESAETGICKTLYSLEVWSMSNHDNAASNAINIFILDVNIDNQGIKMKHKAIGCFPTNILQQSSLS